MDKVERRQAIVEMINREGDVSFTELKSAFSDVSDMTLRTDLKHLDERRLIVRVHGGARSVGFAVGTDGLLAGRTTRHTVEKALIAEKAKGLLHPDSTVLIDSGSTTTALAAVVDDQRLLFFTNSLSVAGELARLERATTHLIGGRLNTYSMDATGGAAIERVLGLSFDILFLGVTAYRKGSGFTCGSDDEAAFKRAAIQSAGKTVVLMDSSKIGRRSTFPICDLSEVDVIVGDDNVPPDFAEQCHSSNVRLL